MNNTSTNHTSLGSTSYTLTDQQIAHIYDKMFKRILTLSPLAVINMINGLFDTNHPTDSEITYNWTEHVDDNLNKTIADTIITINQDSVYHIEAQMYEDEQIELRVFDYGYQHALTSQKSPNILKFPEIRIIYLYKTKDNDNEKTLLLDFGSQGIMEYKVPVFKLLDHDALDLHHKKMTILLPFLMLRLRDELKRKRTTKNIESLKNLIQNDIIQLIRKSLEAGEITRADASRLLEMAHKLYDHLYSVYPEMEKGGINDFMDDKLNILYDLDLWEYNMIQRVTKEVTEKVTNEITEKVTQEVTDEVTQKVTDEVTQKVTDEVTQKVTKEVTQKVTKEVQEDYQRKTILRLYEKLKDTAQIADYLAICESQVIKIIGTN